MEPKIVIDVSEILKLVTPEIERWSQITKNKREERRLEQYVDECIEHIFETQAECDLDAIMEHVHDVPSKHLIRQSLTRIRATKLFGKEKETYRRKSTTEDEKRYEALKRIAKKRIKEMFDETERLSFEEIKSRNPEIFIEDDLREIVGLAGGKLTAREKSDPSGDIFVKIQGFADLERKRELDKKAGISGIFLFVFLGGFMVLGPQIGGSLLIFAGIDFLLMMYFVVASAAIKVTETE